MDRGRRDVQWSFQFYIGRFGNWRQRLDVAVGRITIHVWVMCDVTCYIISRAILLLITLQTYKLYYSTFILVLLVLLSTVV